MMIKQQELEKKNLNLQKLKDEKKLKDLENELKKLKSKEGPKLGKHKSVREQQRRGLGGDSEQSQTQERQQLTREQLEQRERDRDLMLQFMMSNMMEMRPMMMRQQRAEDEMLQAALAESR